MFKTVFRLIGFLILTGCSQLNNFKNPHIRTENVEVVRIAKFNEMKESVCELVYVGKIVDTAKIDSSKTQNHFKFDLKTILKNKKFPIKIHVDVNQQLAYDLEKLSIPPVPILLDSINIIFDSIENKKKLKQWENRQRNYVEAIPVSIINLGKSTIWLVQQDLKIQMIQEAKDRNGNWKPIEFWNYSRCGHSYGNLILKSNEIAIFKVLRYSGDFQTEIRLKIKSGKYTYYSDPFNGSVNQSQFEIPKELFNDRDLTKVEREKIIKTMFLND